MLTDLRTVWDFLGVTSRPRLSDVLFCFGSLHRGVARRAAALYEQGVAPTVLATGGPHDRLDAGPTEADVYAAVLRASGVPEDRMVIEREATNTGENVVFGLRALEARGIDVRRVELVAWPTSLRRCVATFERHAPAVQLGTQPAFSGFGPYAHTTDRAVATVLAELDRLCSYPALGYTTEVRVPREVTEAAQRLEGHAAVLTDSASTAAVR